MNIQVLKFMIHRSGGSIPIVAGPIQDELSVATSHEVEKAKKKHSPLVYVVQAKSLSVLRKMKDAIVDRGQKNVAVQLSRRLLGYEKIPLIDASLPKGGYTAGKHVKKGVRSFLKEAVEQKDGNIYIVGVSTRAFAELSQQAEILDAGAKPPKEQHPRPPLGGGAREWSENGLDQSALQEGKAVEIPGELEEIFVGASPKAKLVRQDIMLAANNDWDVLILGETGTGKDIVAHAIDKFGNRNSGPFIDVNCGGIPSELFEAELFGLEPGIVASRKFPKPGLWELANKGTLFLDEIGDLRLDHQAAILKAIEKKRIRRIGGVREIPVNSRVICATHKDIFLLAETNEFRSDLCARLGTMFQIRTPSLRDDPNGIADVAKILWKKISGQGHQASLPQEILDTIKLYPWPRNIRGLKAVLRELHRRYLGKNLKIHHLHHVLQRLNESGGRAVRFPKVGEVEASQFDVLDNLQKMRDRLQAIQVSIPSLLDKFEKQEEGPVMVNISIKQSLEGLEEFCSQPELFGDEFTFLTVNQLKGKLAYFKTHLNKNSTKGSLYWKKEMGKGFEEAAAAIKRQIEKFNKKAFEPIDTRSTPLTSDILELRERLADHSHEVWAIRRKAEGWRYGPQRNDKRKEHPDLVSYEALPESEKEYDRIAAMEILKAIVALGYSIVRA